MAYLANAFYDDGGRVQTLEAVHYDDGTRRNLAGAQLAAVKYDDGGRFRTLLGEVDPYYFEPPDFSVPSPNINTSAIPIISNAVPAPWTPSPTLNLTSLPISGTLTPMQTSGTPGLLDSIFGSVRSIFSAPVGASTGQLTPGTTISAASWFAQSNVIPGLPNWGLAAGAGVLGLALLGGSKTRGRKRNGRRRNPAELLLMGANPSY